MYLFLKYVDGLKGLKNNDDMFVYFLLGYLYVKFYILLVYSMYFCFISL